MRGDRRSAMAMRGDGLWAMEMKGGGWQSVTCVGRRKEKDVAQGTRNRCRQRYQHEWNQVDNATYRFDNMITITLVFFYIQSQYCDYDRTNVFVTAIADSIL